MVFFWKPGQPATGRYAAGIVYRTSERLLNIAVIDPATAEGTGLRVHFCTITERGPSMILNIRNRNYKIIHGYFPANTKTLTSASLLSRVTVVLHCTVV